MRSTKTAIFSVLFTILASGCGDDSSPGGAGGSMSSGGAGGTGGAGGSGGDHGAPSTTYPAFMPDMPNVLANGRQVLANMKIVTITYAGDPNVAAFEAFGDNIGSTTYWHTLNSEYGVGPTTSVAADHVHIAGTPPTSMSTADVDHLVATNAGNPSSGWPQTDGQTLYAVFLSPMTDLTEGGGSLCQTGVEAYHSQTSTGSGASVPYAVLPQCPQFGYLDVIQSASHEYNEAATDPFGNGYVGFDGDHQSWEVYLNGQDEVGDACEFKFRAFYTDMETNFDYPVQRQWSNASAQAGHNPCVPVENKPYYNVTLFPAEMDTITVNLGYLRLGTVQTKGFKVPMGQSKTFTVGFFSDAAVNMPWTLMATVPTDLPDTTGNPTPNGTAMVTVDKSSGVNGEKAYITVTPTSFNSLGFLYLELESKEPGLEGNAMPVLIAPN